jgi:Domain of unknown function (DUF3471)
VGVYSITGLANLTVSVKDGRLYADVPQLAPTPFELLAASPTRFFILQNGLTAEFVTDAAGQATKINVGGPFGKYEAKRTP